NIAIMTLTLSLSNFLSVRDWFQAHLQIRKDCVSKYQSPLIPGHSSDSLFLAQLKKGHIK
ncbi:MAG: hypothetical protein COT11_06540, partial [Candidatus Infernicultor aquiphilus]